MSLSVLSRQSYLTDCRIEYGNDKFCTVNCTIGKPKKVFDFFSVFVIIYTTRSYYEKLR